MSRRARNKVIVAAVEATYGVDANPNGANAILASSIQITPLEGETVTRENPRPFLGGYEQIHVGTHVKLEFDVELTGAGAAGTIPGYGVLLRGCGFAQTQNAGTSVVFDPVTDNHESLTIYMYLDGQLHVLQGARGDWGIRANSKQIPYLHFAFMGLWVAPNSAAAPTPNFSAFQAPIPVNNDNTPTFVLHGFAARMQSLEITGNQNAAHRDLVGLEEIVINDRQVGGSVTIENPPLATQNFLTAAQANQVGSLQFIHGISAGQIVEITAPRAQILQPNYSEDDQFNMLQMGLSLVPTDTGNDEIQITVR